MTVLLVDITILYAVTTSPFPKIRYLQSYSSAALNTINPFYSVLIGFS